MLIFLFWPKRLRPILKLVNLMIESELLSLRIFFVLNFFCFCFDSFLKTNLSTYKIKDTNGEKIIGSFYEKEFFLRIL